MAKRQHRVRTACPGLRPVLGSSAQLLLGSNSSAMRSRCHGHRAQPCMGGGAGTRLGVRWGPPCRGRQPADPRPAGRTPGSCGQEGGCAVLRCRLPGSSLGARAPGHTLSLCFSCHGDWARRLSFPPRISIPFAMCLGPRRFQSVPHLHLHPPGLPVGSAAGVQLQRRAAWASGQRLGTMPPFIIPELAPP